jgi:hypothetical protein
MIGIFALYLPNITENLTQKWVDCYFHNRPFPILSHLRGVCMCVCVVCMWRSGAAASPTKVESPEY